MKEDPAPTAKSFHHGNLREALLARAEIEIENHGHRVISLRKLAKSLNVSHAAPYRHFDSKESLLLALAQQGLDLLRDKYQAAARDEKNKKRRLLLASQGFLEFAESRPALYQLIFSRELQFRPDLPELASQNSGFSLFEKFVADVLQSDDADIIRRATFVTISTLHGYAMLRINITPEKIDFDLKAIESDILKVACGLSP